MLENKNSNFLLRAVYVTLFGLFLIFIFYATNYFLQSYYLKADKTAISQKLAKYEKELYPAPAAKEVSKKQIFNSFFDSFSNDYLVDLEKTNLYRDNTAAAFMFPPDFVWQSASEEVAAQNKDKLLDPDKRCIGKNCLERKGKELFYQDKVIAFPSELKNKEVTLVSFGVLEKRWLVGFTFKDGDKFQGSVYYFDGKKFSPLPNLNFSSKYEGIFGFGGQENDFLVIYGAYQGIAYRVRGDKISDVSQFFDMRVMNKGFRPEVLRVENQGRVNWYVYSLTVGKPRLIKLWENEKKEISGETIYISFFSSKDEAVSFFFLDANATEINFLVKIKRGDYYYVYSFIDRGFKNNFPGELVFKPVVHDPAITIKSLVSTSLGSPALLSPEGKLSFSSDQKTWQVLPLGEKIKQSFETGAIKEFSLRVDYPAQNDKFYSPFLNQVLFDFYLEK